MPCNGEYLNPTESEANSRLAAELIIYVRKSLKKSIPKFVTETASSVYGAPSRLNELVSMLCTMCSNMSEAKQDRIIYNGRNSTARKLADWWEVHQEADKERLAKDRKTRIKNALKKLTPEEKELLGL